MASITVFQDRENDILEQGNANSGIPRIAPKPFLNNTVHQATPRKALGDVRNIQVQGTNSSLKSAPRKSDKKVPSSASRNSKSAFLKPFGTSKKPNRAIIKVLEDEGTERQTVKKELRVDPAVSCDSNERAEKEEAFPFLDKELEFVMPDYLKCLSEGPVSENIWFPSYIQSAKSAESTNELNLDIARLEIEDLPMHSGLEEPKFDNVMAEVLEVSTDPVFSNSERFCELGPIESDLADIDGYFSFTQYEDVLKRLDALELGCQKEPWHGTDNFWK